MNYIDETAFVPDSSITIEDPFAFFGGHSPSEIRPSEPGIGAEFEIPAPDDDEKPFVQIDLFDATNGEGFVKV